MGEQPILEVRNLKKYFQTPRGLLHAVDDVSFTLESGKTLGVVGEKRMWKIYHWPDNPASLGANKR